MADFTSDLMCMSNKKFKATNVYLAVIFLITGLLIEACIGASNQYPLVSEVQQTAVAPPIVELAQNTYPSQQAPTLTASNDELSCWPIRHLDAKNDIQGSLLFRAYGTQEQRNAPPFYWEINSFQVKLLPGADLWRDKKSLVQGIISPSEREDFLVYFEDFKLTFISPARLISKDIFLPAGSYSLSNDYSQEGYPKNGKFVFRSTEYTWDIKNKNYQEGIGFTDIYYIYDPIAGTLTEHSTFLPGFAPNSRGAFPIAYSPDMRYVVYHYLLPDEENRSGFTLLDIAQQKVKWSIPESYREIGPGDDDIPMWKPDSSGLVYIWFSEVNPTNLDLFFISVDGEIAQLTEMEGVLKAKYAFAFFNSSSWSPNLRYFIFRANIDSLPGVQLLVWDDTEKRVLCPCLPVDSSAFPLYYFVWSPNGEQLQVSLPRARETSSPSDEFRDYFHRQLILDISKMTIFELPEISKRGEYSLFDSVGNYDVWGWSNWEIP